MTEHDGYEKVSLANLASGAAVERFDAELARVLDNIADLNTKTKEARTITLKVKIVPTEDRAFGVVEVTASSKLAGMEAVGASVELVQEGRKQAAYQRKAKQGDLFPEGAKVMNVGHAKKGE